MNAENSQIFTKVTANTVYFRYFLQSPSLFPIEQLVRKWDILYKCNLWGTNTFATLVNIHYCVLISINLYILNISVDIWFSKLN